MALIKQVKAVLKAFDFDLATQIIVNHSENRVLIGLLQKGDSPANRLLARNELSHLLTTIGTAPTNGQGVAPVAERTANDPLSDIKAERNEIIKKMDRLHESLFHEDNKEEHRLIALQILDLNDRYIECWEKIDYHKQHGRLPPEPESAPVEIEDPVLLLKREKQIMPRISQLKKQPDKVTQLKKYQEELESVRAKLQKLGYK